MSLPLYSRPAPNSLCSLRCITLNSGSPCLYLQSAVGVGIPSVQHHNAFVWCWAWNPELHHARQTRYQRNYMPAHTALSLVTSLNVLLIEAIQIDKYNKNQVPANMIKQNLRTSGYWTEDLLVLCRKVENWNYFDDSFL